VILFPRNFVSCNNKKKVAGLAKFLIEENSSDSMSVLLITKSYIFFFFIATVCCRIFMGCTKKKSIQHSSDFFPLDRPFSNQKFCLDNVQMSPPRGPTNQLCCTLTGQLMPSAWDWDCQEASGQVGAAQDTHSTMTVESC